MSALPLSDQIRHQAEISARPGQYDDLFDLAEQVDDLCDDLDALRRATGGLPPALVAKALDYLRTNCEYDLKHDGDVFTHEDYLALRAATFEVPADS